MAKAIDEDLFWEVVKDCLQEIYAVQAEEAAARSLAVRTKMQKSLPRKGQELFYHAEPLDVAADLACTGKHLTKADMKKYDAILARHKW